MHETALWDKVFSCGSPTAAQSIVKNEGLDGDDGIGKEGQISLT